MTGGYVYGLKQAGAVIVWDGDVTLMKGAMFNITAYNSGVSYRVNQTTVMGALHAAAEKGKFDYTTFIVGKFSQWKLFSSIT
jgi:hypothetical protein